MAECCFAHRTAVSAVQGHLEGGQGAGRGGRAHVKGAQEIWGGGGEMYTQHRDSFVITSNTAVHTLRAEARVATAMERGPP